MTQNPQSPRRSPLLVVAAIIRDGERLLIARRKLDARSEAGKWEFPGGKVEYAEHPEESLRREIREELNLEIKIDRLFDVTSLVSVAGNNASSVLHIVLIAYLARVVSGRLELLDAADAKWVQRGELGAFDFAAADIPFVEKLREAIDLHQD